MILLVWVQLQQKVDRVIPYKFLGGGGGDKLDMEYLEQF